MSYGAHCALAIRHEDIVYSSLPLYHTAGVIIGVGQCFIGGCTLALRRKFSASKFWDDCVEYKATVSAEIFKHNFNCKFWIESSFS